MLFKSGLNNNGSFFSHTYYNLITRFVLYIDEYYMDEIIIVCLLNEDQFSS